MRLYIVCFLIVGTISICLAKSNWDTYVKKLDDKSHAKFINSKKSFVVYHTTWSKYSVKAQMSFGDTAKKMGKSVLLGEVDCDKFPDTCSNTAKSVKGYPTMYCYTKGKFVEEYMGEHNAKDMVKYLTLVSKKELKLKIELNK